MSDQFWLAVCHPSNGAGRTSPDTTTARSQCAMQCNTMMISSESLIHSKHISDLDDLGCCAVLALRQHVLVCGGDGCGSGVETAHRDIFWLVNEKRKKTENTTEKKNNIISVGFVSLIWRRLPQPRHKRAHWVFSYIQKKRRR